MYVKQVNMADNEISQNIRLICKNKKNTNKVQELLQNLEEGEEDEILKSMEILCGVFSFHIRENTWMNSNKSTDEQLNDNDDVNREATYIVASWLKSSYKAFLSILADKISQSSPVLQVKALNKFLDMISFECSVRKNENTRSISSGKELKILNFPNHHFILLVKQFLWTPYLSEELFQKLNSIFKFFDIQYYCLKNIPSLLLNEHKNITETVVENTFKVMLLISKNVLNVEEEQIVHLQTHVILLADLTKKITKSYKSKLSIAWLSFLRLPKISIVMRKKILVDLDSKIMPYLSDSKLLIDFLTDSYSAGGVTSLLALNGLFILMNQYNLDFPDFYVKLYSIIDPTIFHMKYKARFFHLINLFLTSTHLPSYLVAAFVKKFSRILLFTPAPDVMLVLTFIKNMFIRHPSSRILIHRKKGNKDYEETSTLKSDPYDYEEIDPSKCGASKSCLWEVDTMFSHYSSEVKKTVASFRKDFQSVEVDISDHFEQDYENLFEAKINKFNEEELPLFDYMKEKELFEGLDTKMWCLE